MNQTKNKSRRNRRLSAAVFKNIVLGTLIVLVAAFALTLLVVYRQFTTEFKHSLYNEARSVGNIVEVSGLNALKSYKISYRITVVDKDGTVVYDNMVDPALLDNHNDRQEIIQARKKGRGESVRSSDTLSARTVNEAVLLKDGRVLRVSGNQSSQLSFFLKTALPLLAVALFAIGLALILARITSKQIVDPINKIDIDDPDPGKVYAELTPLVERIDVQSQMRREFTANVSHELKTPLTSISGYAELIETGIAKDEDVKRFAGKIHEESLRLVTLVGDIIKLSQLDGNDVIVKKEDIDLYDTCRSVLSQLEHAAGKKGVTLYLAGDRMTIRGVSQIIEEMIFNLCDNAIKYNKPGGRVDVGLHKTDKGAEVTVADTGIGIPEADRVRIFERFYRVDKSHSKEIGGTGLGLSIVKHGAMYTGASVSVESREGEGSTFKIIFPM